MNQSMRVATILFLLQPLALSAAEEDASPDSTQGNSSQAAQRLEFMKSSIADYDFRLGPDFKGKLTVDKEPVLRFTNAVSGLQDGAFFLWKDDAGRPMISAQVFLTSEDIWLHEFQSLATTSLRGSRNGVVPWEPSRAGVESRPVPDAPEPAKTAVQRLVQMRNIAGRFSVSDEFEGRERSDELRLMSKPLARFGREDSPILDGALFTQAHGTDPELLILVEALKTNDGFRWHYSLAPMTGYALQARLDDKLVWEVEWRKGPFDPKEPFTVLVHSRETQETDSP